MTTFITLELKLLNEFWFESSLPIYGLTIARIGYPGTLVLGAEHIRAGHVYV